MTKPTDSDKNKPAPATGPTPRILPVDIAAEMKESYLDYAMSVIVSRALPDVRDGLKPVHRRILYAMHEEGLRHTAKHSKCAGIVGDVLKKFHPHGDTAVYDALVRLAQPWNMRYPLIDGQGNFGSMDGDSPAAYRYTEARLTRLAGETLADIEKNTVDFRPNYDGTRREPAVLPSRLPQLLLAGTIGIAVGMATKIPPHNLAEVMSALIHLIDNPDMTTEDLLEFVKGPDFPTGGMVFNETDIHHAYASGRGGVLCRGEAEIVEAKTNNSQIVITSLPYQVNKAELVIKIADLVRDKKLEGIRDLRDESARGEVRIAIDLKSGAYPEKILHALYKYTDLETVFHYNMLALADGTPQLMSLKVILEAFIKHRLVTVTRRTKFDLDQAEARGHILLGLSQALDQIDAVIKTIKKSGDAAEAHRALIAGFKLSAIQATAILEMKLQKLAGLERQKIEDELKEKQNLIKELKTLLADPKKLRQVIKDEFTEIKDAHGDTRRTKVIAGGVKEITTEDMVPEKENVLVLTAGGYIKRTDPSEYRAQRRGGIGVIDLDIKEEDFVTIFLTASTHDDLLFFTDRGKVYQLKMYDLPEGKRATRGKSVMNFLALAADERVTSVLALPKTLKGERLALILVTRQGVAKKVSAASFKDVRRSGIIAVKLTKGDELLAVRFVRPGDEAILASRAGQAIRFKASDIREMGRGAAGVRAMRLGTGDIVIAADAITPAAPGSEYLVVSENGFGKKTPLKEYKVQKRGGSGIKTFKVTAKTGRVMAGRVLGEADAEIITVSKQGQVIRTKLAEISSLGRQTQGVRIMKMHPGDTIASLTCL